MKKIVLFLITIFSVIIIYVLLFNREMNYKLDYEVDKIQVSEIYDKEKKYYTFTVKNNNNDFIIQQERKYSTSRKLIKSVSIVNLDEYKCATIKVNDEYLPSICYDGKNFVDSYIAGLNKNNKENKINTINDIEVYNRDFDYYIWNGKGLTNVLTSKKYNFLDKEHYDNDISIKFGDYILFADYDASREFDKLYIFNNKDKKIEEFKLKYKVSNDSYFNGIIDDDIYLFDKKNKCQYKINIIKNKVSISSTNDYAISYGDKEDEVPLSEFVYSKVNFKKRGLIDFYTKNNILYYKYYSSKEAINISDKKIKDIISTDNSKVFYLVDDSLYYYDLYKGESKLLTYFEWNFSYKNKIFVF